MDHDGWNWFSHEDGIGRAREEVQDRFDLLERHRWIVLYKLVQGLVLQVLEDCGYGQAGTAKNPGSAHLPRGVFRLRLPEDRDIAVGILPGGEEILVGGLCLGRISRESQRSAKL